MRDLYDEFFRIPKHGKIKEKVMLTRVIITVAVVIFCLLAMSITAYAYFSYNVTSASDILKAAHFEAKISLQITDENGQVVIINPITANYKSFKVDLEADKLYTVTVVPTENSSAKTGFLVMTADHCDGRYHTRQLGKNGDETVDSLSFKIRLNAAACVKFFAHWGTSSYYGYPNEDNELYIKQDETVELTVTPPATESTTQTTTTAATTTTGFPIGIATTTAAETTVTTAATTAE